MPQHDRITVHDAGAASYDQDTVKAEYYCHEALFGMMFAGLRAGQTVADIGTGTGISAELFTLCGLRVTGYDGSDAMLEQAQEKGAAVHLIQHDFTRLPLPGKDGSFDHAVCSGVFHFFRDPRPLIADIARLVCPDGWFGFSVLCPPDDKPDPQASIETREEMTAWGVPVYHHPYPAVMQMLHTTGFRLLKRQRALMLSGPGDAPDLHTALYVVQRIDL